MNVRHVRQGEGQGRRASIRSSPFLTLGAGQPVVRGDIKWNFNKFLVGKDGDVLARFEPQVEPTSPEVIAAIEKALG